MSNKTTNQYTFAVNHSEAAKLIAANGSKISYVIEGEPGTSKSSILKTLEKNLGNAYEYIYIDVPLKDIPDIALSMPDHETQMVKAYTNSIWVGTDAKKPKVIMLDEVFKGSEYVKLMMNRLLLERTVGGLVLPEGSIVFGTTNLATDGVGDRTNGHTNSRVSRITMRKPSLQEWTHWATNNNVNDIVLAWVQQNPKMFTSYMEEEFNDKEHKEGVGIFNYIFHPQHNNKAYVAPRTLELASHQLHNMDLVGHSLTEKALIGTIGLKAALDMSAYIALGADLPMSEDIEKSPEHARIPKNPIAKLIMVYKSTQYLTDDNLDKYVQYFERFDNLELMVMWVRTILNIDGLRSITHNKTIIRKFQDNINIITPT